MQKATFYDAKGNLSCFKRIAIVFWGIKVVRLWGYRKT